MGTIDQILDLLSKERRRYALYYLTQQDGPISVTEVAEQVTEWETTGPPATISDERFEQVKIELLHTDLPKVSEANYINYDSERGIVELSGTPPGFDAIISLAKVIERPDRNP